LIQRIDDPPLQRGHPTEDNKQGHPRQPGKQFGHADLQGMKKAALGKGGALIAR
jgi:hypothetical protein